MFKLTKNKKAFTLIELLVVIAVLGILVLIATPKLFNYTQKAELVRIQHDVKVMEQEMKIALIDSEVKIADWNSNKKNLGTLIMQNKLFEKEGVTKRIDTSHLAKNGALANKDLDNIELAEMQTEKDLGIGGEYFVALSESDKSSEFTSVDESYKIIPQNYKKNIRTKLGGTFYTNEDGKVYYEHDRPITGDEIEDKKVNCPLPLPDYDFEPETGTILKWHGTVTHLIIPEAFKVTIDGEEECVPVRIIGEAAFMQGGFKSIVIPQSVIIIEEDAFKDNELTEIEIPHSVENVGGNAFVGNDFGSSGGNGGSESGGNGENEGGSESGGNGGKNSPVIIKNNPTNITIVPGAFENSTPVFKPVSPQDLDVIFNPSNGKIISGSSSSKVISIPESFWVGGVEYPVKEISKGAYQGLGLISVTLPSGLERIEDYAFAGNQLEGIVIPDKINYIGNYAFAFNEVVHTESGDKKATIEFIKIKNEEQFHKVNQYGDIYESNMKVDKLKGEVELLNHIFVTSIANHVIDEKYVDDKDTSINPEPTDPDLSSVYMATDADFSGDSIRQFRYIGKGHSEIEIPHVIKGVPITSYYRMFYEADEDLVKVVSTNPNVTDMRNMFENSKSQKLDLKSLDTSNTTDMNSMFKDSHAIEIDLSSFDTRNVTNMQSMFYNSHAEKLDLSSLNTKNVTNMTWMLGYSHAVELNINSFKTSKVTRMSNMFAYSNADELDLSSFDTSNVTNMSSMFLESKANTLDLSSFNTSNVISMDRMFQYANATKGYARSESDANNFNKSSGKKSTLIFTVNK